MNVEKLIAENLSLNLQNSQVFIITVITKELCFDLHSPLWVHFWYTSTVPLVGQSQNAISIVS